MPAAPRVRRRRLDSPVTSDEAVVIGRVTCRSWSYLARAAASHSSSPSSTCSSRTPQTARRSPSSTANTSTESNTDKPTQTPSTRRSQPHRLPREPQSRSEFRAVKRRNHRSAVSLLHLAEQAPAEVVGALSQLVQASTEVELAVRIAATPATRQSRTRSASAAEARAQREDPVDRGGEARPAQPAAIQCPGERVDRGGALGDSLACAQEQVHAGAGGEHRAVGGAPVGTQRAGFECVGDCDALEA